MKKKWFVLIIGLAVLCLLAGGAMAMSPDACEHKNKILQRDKVELPTCEKPGKNVYVCDMCSEEFTETVPATGHTWGEWKITTEANCSTAGVEERACTVCGKTESRAVAKTDTHTWGEWGVSKEPTCLATGLRTRKCSVCGATENETIPRKDHQWSEWEIKKEPTCTEKGKKSRVCSLCGGTENLNIKELGHEAEEWTVTKEPTCRVVGEKEGECIRCGKKLTKKLNRVDHDYEEWETVEDATDFSKGKRKSECRFCKRKKTEEFYPEGTLAADLENDPEDVRALQIELKTLGLFKKDTSGKFDKATVDAVKKAEKGLGLKQDGICWPGLRKLLMGWGGDDWEGGIGGGEDGAGPDPSKYKLQLTVKRTSPQKDYYAIDDEITYEWTLTNASKTKCTKAKMYHYDIDKKLVKQKEVEIEDIGTLKPGESATGTYTYKVTKEDVLAGKFRHGFIGRGNLGGKAASNPRMFTHSASAGTGGTGGWTPPSEEAITIKKTVDNTPVNTFFFVKGEKVKFKIEVKNKSTGDVDDVILTDKLLGDSWKKSIGTLSGGESKTFDVEYVITTKEVSACEVENTAVVSYTQDGKTKMSKDTAKAKAGMNASGLYIYKVCTVLPKNGLFFEPGETVEFDIQVINPTTDKTFKNLEIFDWLYSKTKAYKKHTQLKPGQSVTFTFKTKVTEFQAKTGKLTNKVSVSYKDPDKKKRMAQSNECTVPCGMPGTDGVTVTKKVISTPDNGSYYQEGEEIRYLIEIANNTVKDITAMDIRDSLADLDANGYRTIQAGETLEAGKTYEIHFSYFVTAGDVENTKVTNVASAYWSVKKDEYTETYSDPVTVPTAATVSDRKPELKNLGGDACTPSLKAMGEGVSERELTECDEHTETAKEAEKLIAGGDYAAAVQLWDAEIGNLYREWEQNSDGEARRIAENEEAAFGHQMAALEDSLALVCKDKEAQAIAAEERMEKCIGLCYELHTAPEDRPDSAEGDYTELKKGKAAKKCSRDVEYTEDGPVRLEDDQCESHTLTASLTQALLEAAEDDEDREIAWLRAQGNWLLELDLMYDTWYLSADASQKAKIAADRMSFDELINARRESLAQMYPDDPAAAAEVLANMIMHRTEMVCRILHEAGILK